MEIQNNLLVTVNVEDIESIDGESISLVSTSFVTHMEPLYSTPLKIREIIGSYIVEITDDILNQLILKYSLEADIIAICDKSLYDKWQYFAMKWVTYKAAIDAVYNSNIYIGESQGKTYKKLGDFAISKDTSKGISGGPTNALLKKLECEVFKLEVAVRFCKQPLLECDSDALEDATYNPQAAKIVVKGECTDRPIFGRDFYQIGSHPGWTGWFRKNNKKYLTNYNP